MALIARETDAHRPQAPKFYATQYGVAVVRQPRRKLRKCLVPESTGVTKFAPTGSLVLVASVAPVP